MVEAPEYINLVGTLTRNKINEGKWLRVRIPGQVAYFFVHISAQNINPNASEAEERAQLEAIAIYHINKDWGRPGSPAYGWCAMYHWAIGPSGRIYVLNPITHILWNTTDGNPFGAATMLLLGENQEPTPAQIATLNKHLDYQESLGITQATRHSTFGHGECGQIWGGGPNFHNNTQCPGKVLPFVRERRASVAPPQPISEEYHFFPETGHTIGHGFLDFWKANGGLPVFGYPLTEESDGAAYGLPGYTVQFTQRARFEYNGATGTTTLGLLGAELLRAQGRVPGTVPVDPAFEGFYNANGGLVTFGVPVLPAEVEHIAGVDLRVQWFERARMELHPEGIMLGLLGAELQSTTTASNVEGCGCERAA